MKTVLVVFIMFEHQALFWYFVDSCFRGVDSSFSNACFRGVDSSLIVCVFLFVCELSFMVDKGYLAKSKW
jgi:hypothetical protein